jgi:FAD/FMN-containing dehydrogenase
LHAGAGATWTEVIAYLDAHGRSVDVMQSNNSFTVGGSVSANCHGWEPTRPPIAASVSALDLVGADGVRRRCSRSENAELFSLVLGGYGLFGVILHVDLQVVANERYLAVRREVAPEQLPDLFQELDGDAGVAMAFARLSVDRERFLDEAVLTVFRRDPAPDGSIPPLDRPGLEALKRAVFRGAEGDEYGKRLRWDLEKRFGQHLAGRSFSRNQLLNEPVELYQNRSHGSTDIIQEYFVPPERFASFLAEVRRIIPAHGGDLLNATVRRVLTDQDTFLRYADRDMVALVLLFAQERSDEGERRMAAMTRDLIDGALGASGRYYLPYRLHATAGQFHAAYPQAHRFFALKRQYDPEELFQNQFYLTYGCGEQ